jgi:hypothetical protein
LKGVLFGFPGVMKLESCMNPQHFNWVFPRLVVASLQRSVAPELIMGPVKVTIGGIIGKVFAICTGGGMLWHSLIVSDSHAVW